jgi:AraC-like DNA-binding protein
MTRPTIARDGDKVVVFRRARLPGIALSEVDAVGATAPRVSLDFIVALNVGRPHRYVAHGSRWIVDEGALVVTEPGQVFSVEPCARRHRVDVLFLDAATVTDPEVREAWRYGAFRRLPVVNDRRLRQRFRELAVGVRGRHVDELEAAETLAAFVGSLRAAHTGYAPSINDAGIDRDAIRRAVELLHDAFADPLTLDELARASELPKMRFLRSFKRNVGMSPHAYQVKLRVDLARRMLVRGAGVADAAAAAGFCDQSHLHRHFTRSVGVTPGVYRRRVTE